MLRIALTVCSLCLSIAAVGCEDNPEDLDYLKDRPGIDAGAEGS